MWCRGLSQCLVLPGTGPARGLNPGPARGDNLLGLPALTAAWTLGGPQAALKWAAHWPRSGQEEHDQAEN